MISPTAKLPSVSRRKTAAINLAFHYISILITLAHGILLAPLYLKHLGPPLYGAWLATGNVITWIELVDPGLGAVLQQKVAAAFGSRKPEELKNVIGNGLILSVFLSLLPLIAWPASQLLPELFEITGDGSTELSKAFTLALISSATAFASFAVTAVNIGLQRATATGVVYVVAALTGLGSTIILLEGKVGLRSLPIGMLVRNVILLGGNLLLFFVWKSRHLPGKFAISLKETMKLSKLLSVSFLGRLGGTLFERMESFFTATLISPQAAAVLSLTGRPFEPVKLATTRISAALAPSLAHLSGEGDLRKIDAWVHRMNLAVTTISIVGIATVVCFNGDLVALWVGGAMFGGMGLTVAVAAACSLHVMTSHLAQVLFSLGKIKDITQVTSLEGFIKVPILYFGLQHLGIIGAPLATLVATLLVSAWKLPSLYAETVNSFRTVPLLFWAKRQVWTVLIAFVLVAVVAYCRQHGLLLTTWPSLALWTAVSAGLIFLCIAVLSAEVRSWFYRARFKNPLL